MASLSSVAFIKITIVFIYLMLLHYHQITQANNSHVPGSEAPARNSSNIDCGLACAGRCRESSRPNLCKRACGTCCDRCHCVPPGTSGHYEACPCYRDQTTRGGARKCP